MVLSDSVMLYGVQKRMKSRTPTEALFFPMNLERDVVLRLEAARLIINHNQWLTAALQPILAERHNPENMWTPKQLEKTLNEMRKGEQTPVLIEDYLRDYQAFYDAAAQ